MNKRANRKAFFILLCVGLMYLSTAFNITEKFSMKRTMDTRAAATPAGFTGAIAELPSAGARSATATTSPAIEPGFFIAIPIVSFAIKEGLIEKEGLIFIKGIKNTRTDFKKPVEILTSKDEDGLVSIAEIIGKKQLLHLLKREDITIKDDLELSDIVLGKGYTVEKKALLALYDAYVTDEYANVFPFGSHGFEIAKKSKGFEITEAHDRIKTQNRAADEEWVMPNLVNLPMKAALEKVALKTSRVKIYGSGPVTDQTPKAFEKMKGESQCALYGRSFK